ncbi:MAG TPA: hypothetical protein VFU09_02905, partial [Candidatus Udaeobacter sp.]|nr:hypothetical protein [Candidatus Udaeobacter sp.]
DTASAENSMVAASNSQHDACVMREAVRQSINRILRQANSKVAADHIPVLQYTRDFIQASVRDFRIDMHEPEHVAKRSMCARIHLPGPIGVGPNELIAKARAEISCVIGAFAVDDNNFSFRRSVTEMLKKWPYQRRLVKDGNND